MCSLFYYPPENKHIPPFEKENNVQKSFEKGYLSSQEGIFIFKASSKQIIPIDLINKHHIQ